MVAEKEGYKKAKKQLDSEEFNIEMIKLKKIPFKVLYHRYNSDSGIIESGQEISNFMNVSIQLTTDDYDLYKMYPVSSDLDMEARTIALIDADATYDVNLVLTENGEYVGGYYGEWNPSGGAVSSANEVVFHVLKYIPVPYTKEAKMEMMGFLLEDTYSGELMPELI